MQAHRKLNAQHVQTIHTEASAHAGSAGSRSMVQQRHGSYATARLYYRAAGEVFQQQMVEDQQRQHEQHNSAESKLAHTESSSRAAVGTSSGFQSEGSPAEMAAEQSTVSSSAAMSSGRERVSSNSSDEQMSSESEEASDSVACSLVRLLTSWAQTEWTTRQVVCSPAACYCPMPVTSLLCRTSSEFLPKPMYVVQYVMTALMPESRITEAQTSASYAGLDHQHCLP